MSHFLPRDRDTPYLLPPSLDDWLPKNHLARFVAEKVGELLARAEGADAEPLAEGLNLPEELAQREERLKAVGDVKAEIKARVAERFAREQADHEAKVKARQEQEARTAQKPRGTPRAPPRPGPRAEDHMNLTDPD